MQRRGLTIVELLVVIAVIGVVIALLLAAIQHGREAARRTQCANNLRQMGLAIQNYHSVYRMYPAGSSRGISLHVALLPYFEMKALADQVVYGDPYAVGNAPVRNTLIPLFSCPSDPVAISPLDDGSYGSSYAGNYGSGFQKHGYNGVFRTLTRYQKGSVWHGGPMTSAMILDGHAQTAMLAEILPASGRRESLRTLYHTPTPLGLPDQLEEFAKECDELDVVALAATPQDDWFRGRSWIRGDAGGMLYNHVLTPNRFSCKNFGHPHEGAHTAASLHPGGVHVLFSDDHVAFVTNDVKKEVWRAYGSRNGMTYGETTALP